MGSRTGPKRIWVQGLVSQSYGAAEGSHTIVGVGVASQDYIWVGVALGDFVRVRGVGCNLFGSGRGPKVFGVEAGSKGIESQGHGRTVI